MTEVRLLAAKWQVASIHRNGPDLVLGYRNAKRMAQLVARSAGPLKVIDDKDVYFRLQEGEKDPTAMYEMLKRLLRGPKDI
jgi:transcription-repair coupling factor (superfamily II helicase)